MARPLTVLYDLDCGFCRYTLSLLLKWDRRGELLPEPIQSEDGQRLLAAVPPDRRLTSAHAVTPEGTVYSGGDAVGPIADRLPGGKPVAWLARRFAAPTQTGYSWVARNRTGLSRFVPARRKDAAQAAIERHRDRVLAPR